MGTVNLLIRFIADEHDSGNDEREQVINNTVGNERSEKNRLVVISGNDEQKQGFKNAQAARNLAENTQNLSNDEDADEYVKRQGHKVNQHGIQNQRGHEDVGAADENLSQSHAERGNVKFNLFDDNRLFVEQGGTQVNSQSDSGNNRDEQGGEFGNGAVAEGMVRGQKIAADNQEKAGNQVGEAGKGDHADDLGGMKAPAGVQTIADGAPGNNGMAGVVADGKADEAGKNPFPWCQFAVNVAQSQVII